MKNIVLLSIVDYFKVELKKLKRINFRFFYYCCSQYIRDFFIRFFVNQLPGDKKEIVRLQIILFFFTLSSCEFYQLALNWTFIKKWLNVFSESFMKQHNFNLDMIVEC